MKFTVTSVAIVICVVRASQALSIGNGTVTVTSVLPAITVSSCLPSGIAPSQITPVVSSGLENPSVYTTVLSQPCPSGFFPVTYTVTGQPANVPPGFTTGVAVVYSRTELVTYPTASASDYMKSGYVGSGMTAATPAAVGGNAGSGSSQDGSLGSPGSASSQGNAAPDTGSPPATSGGVTVPAGAAGSGVGNSNAGGSNAGDSPTTQPKGSSNSTVPASTSSMAIYTGGANSGRLSDSSAGPMLAVLFAGALLI